MVCVFVAVGGLAILFCHLPFRRVWSALTGADYRWVFGAIAVYGFLFLPAAWRWHIALRSTLCDRGAWTTMRFTLVGHFFYNIFFGAVGGDAAKSAMYAQQQQCRFEDVLAAAPLDRLMGLAGLIIFSALILACTFLAKGFSSLGPNSWNFHWNWFWVALVIFVPLAWWIIRKKGETLLGRFLASFRLALGKLVRDPKQVLPGVACGVLVQIALSAVIGLSLRAVAHEQLPWGSFLWTFPLIVIASGLPVTFAGFGTREGAAIFLFGLYGVPRAEAVAASLLAVTASLFWAVVGAALFWRESRRNPISRSTRPSHEAGCADKHPATPGGQDSAE
jgi:uncharacterized membrane protein YbhN (UPF0104 family)